MVALKMFWCAYKNPQVLNKNNFKMLADLLGLILKVGKEDRHMMTHIAFVHPETGKEHQVVSIWAGAGVSSSPTKRIAELLEENQRLKFMLQQATERKQENK